MWHEVMTSPDNNNITAVEFLAQPFSYYKNQVKSKRKYWKSLGWPFCLVSIYKKWWKISLVKLCVCTGFLNIPKKNTIFAPLFLKLLKVSFLMSLVSHKKSYLVCDELTNFRIFTQPIFFQSTKLRQPTEGRDSCLKIDKYYRIFLNSTIQHIPNSFSYEKPGTLFCFFLMLEMVNKLHNCGVVTLPNWGLEVQILLFSSFWQVSVVEFLRHQN